ncbi:hypothetical protein [Cyanobium gracile]|uniref:Uncharacterized protein n=1 Tax=Cyanobium gracile UHCC 0281 TaxID=3110309 RepID=A0ABU5SV48_9CYAN|nr:hypothetical protein [Cyanobium gracile]MEA5442379.1 hypothetical protein [Cyanobium gracile UHCC 0281]
MVELLVAACLGLLVWGVVLQALVADGQRVERLVRLVRERRQQRRVLALLRGDLLRAQRVDLAVGTGAACGLGGRAPVLQLSTLEGPITYTVGVAPSAIRRGPEPCAAGWARPAGTGGHCGAGWAAAPAAAAGAAALRGGHQADRDGDAGGGALKGRLYF